MACCSEEKYPLVFMAYCVLAHTANAPQEKTRRKPYINLRVGTGVVVRVS